MNQEKFILLGNGSFYSIAVLGHLLKQRVTPVALVLPQYPPDAASPSGPFRWGYFVPSDRRA